MIKAGAIDKGMFLLLKNDPHLVVEREFVNPGKGSAFVRMKLKNLITGQALKETMKTQDNVEEAVVTEKGCQYLYADPEAYHFMDVETFEQFTVPFAGFEDKQLFMIEGDTYKVVVWGEKPIDVKVPYKMVYTVTEASEGVKGDTVTKTTKPVKVETGLVVRVPLFIKEGERIMVNTETKEYVERVNS
ncbi:MAG: elongation factor P [Spirochaetia bacterium]|jgi:elongation factor P|nr:elongation factor P [Spirochaetia bacterium]